MQDAPNILPRVSNQLPHGAQKQQGLPHLLPRSPEHVAAHDGQVPVRAAENREMMSVALVHANGVSWRVAAFES